MGWRRKFSSFIGVKLTKRLTVTMHILNGEPLRCSTAYFDVRVKNAPRGDSLLVDDGGGVKHFLGLRNVV